MGALAVNFMETRQKVGSRVREGRTVDLESEERDERCILCYFWPFDK